MTDSHRVSGEPHALGYARVSTQDQSPELQLDALHQAGCERITEQIDTTSAGGRLVFHIFGAMAEFERLILRERTRAGLDAAKTRGRTVCC